MGDFSYKMIMKPDGTWEIVYPSQVTVPEMKALLYEDIDNLLIETYLESGDFKEANRLIDYIRYDL